MLKRLGEDASAKKINTNRVIRFVVEETIEFVEQITIVFSYASITVSRNTSSTVVIPSKAL